MMGMHHAMSQIGTQDNSTNMTTTHAHDCCKTYCTSSSCSTTALTIDSTLAFASQSDTSLNINGYHPQVVPSAPISIRYRPPIFR